MTIGTIKAFIEMNIVPEFSHYFGVAMIAGNILLCCYNTGEY
jgi:hypothetical protein